LVVRISLTWISSYSEIFPLTTSNKFYIQTYGCQMNLNEGEEMAGICGALGLEETKEYAQADVVILNSCSIRQAAEDKVYGWAKKVDKKGKQRFGSGESDEPLSKSTSPSPSDSVKAAHPLMILTGCMVGSARGDRRRIPEEVLLQRAKFVDYFMDQGEYARQLPYILMREGLTPDVVAEEAFSPALQNPALIAKRQVGTHAYVKISEGCDNFCTFCVVPYARGAERSKPQTQILDEVNALVARGFHHITLLGQNVNSWGIENPAQKRAIRINSDQQLPFAALLREIHQLNRVEKISFMTSNPFDFTQDMINTLKLPKMDRYLHMAVQSGSDSVLKRMNRRHTAAEFLQLVNDLRAAVPDIQIGTDLIVGFCGESEEEFLETLRLVEMVRFEMAYMAMYSTRPGTLAAQKFQDDVPREVKKLRYARLADLVEKIQRERAAYK